MTEIEYCLKFLATDKYVWDMRAWHKYKDAAEVVAWVEQAEPDHKNCGHAGHCIQILKMFGVPIEMIVNIIISNPNKRYDQRLAACMAGEDCPVESQFPKREDGSIDYSERTCWKCNGEKINPYKGG